MLVVLSGLPGVGKTTIARELAKRIAAIHLRIDSIEQAIRNAQGTGGHIGDAGYRVAYAIAEDNLRIGRIVIADCVNPITASRDAWRNVAARCNVHAIEVEVQCSNEAEHRRRVEERVADISGLRPPTWSDVIRREYESWRRETLVIDTAVTAVDACVEQIQLAMKQAQLRPIAESRS